jgi:hypothetical protein
MRPRDPPFGEGGETRSFSCTSRLRRPARGVGGLVRRRGAKGQGSRTGHREVVQASPHRVGVCREAELQGHVPCGGGFTRLRGLIPPSQRSALRRWRRSSESCASARRSASVGWSTGSTFGQPVSRKRDEGSRNGFEGPRYERRKLQRGRSQERTDRGSEATLACVNGFAGGRRLRSG